MFQKTDSCEEEMHKLSTNHQLLIASFVLIGNDQVKQQKFMNLIKHMAKPRINFDQSTRRPSKETVNKIIDFLKNCVYRRFKSCYGDNKEIIVGLANKNTKALQ